MLKILLLTIALVCIVAYIYIRWQKKHALNIERPFSTPLHAKNTIIVFDIHGVLFHHNYPLMIRKSLYNGALFRVLPHVLNKNFLKDFFSMVRRNALAEEYIIGLASRHAKIAPFIPLGIDIANAQKANEPVIAIVKELKKRGYQLHILSNIGSIIFEDLRAKNPDIFALFDEIKVAKAEEGYLGKPHRMMFNNYQIQLNKENKFIIFIDDKSKNIKAARAQTMVSIYVCCTYHLYKKLYMMGFIF